jgi:glycine hydroxymethyltransferase
MIIGGFSAYSGVVDWAKMREIADSIGAYLFVDMVDKNLTGKEADAALGRANITVNKNSVPNDPKSPFVTSGIRVGTPAITRRGFKEAEAKELAGWMCDVLDSINDEAVIERIKGKVLDICARYPVYA